MFSAKDMVRIVAATVIAVVAALTGRALAGLVGVDLRVVGPRGPVQVPAGAVVLATAAAGWAAWLLVRLARRARRPRRRFTQAVAIGLLASSVPPVQAATTVSTAGWLLALHAVVAVPLVTTGWRILPDERLDDKPAGAQPVGFAGDRS